jgi:beta-hydroxyacyl-ACP dehydratase FabZ
VAEAPLAVVSGPEAPPAVGAGPSAAPPIVAGAAPRLEAVSEPAAPKSLGIREVLQYLPHRYPMLLVDRVESLVPGVSATGIKCVTVNEPYMVGHFPGYPIMPGVLIVDALAQVGGIMLRSAGAPAGAAPQGGESRPGVLATIQRMRFLRQVLPGDRLSLKVRLQKRFGSLHQVAVEASVDGDVVATGELVLAS